MSSQSEKQLRARAAAYLNSEEYAQHFFDETAEKNIPRFEPQEVKHGTLLGTGGFCVVVEVEEIQLESDVLDEGPKDTNEEGAPLIQNRRFISDNVLRYGQARYAIKSLSPNLYLKARSTFLSGIVDLAMEVKYLSVLHHSHIIKMRGRANTHPCSDNFFIVLDRLHDTLKQRIEIWRKEVKQLSGLGASIRDLKKVKKTELLGQRLAFSHDICSALSYMHSKRVVYRDLKPDNIGFDVRGDVKIFDFGLAKLMEEKSRVKGSDTFKLTKRCGSPRYMAPEIFIGLPYNQSADVYSFGLILWQIIHLKKPFPDHDYSMIEVQVMHGNERPLIDHRKVSTFLQELITSCWSPDSRARPGCGSIIEELKAELLRLCGARVLDALDVSNRTEASAHVRDI